MHLAPAGYCTLRADLLEHALRAVGLQLPVSLGSQRRVLSVKEHLRLGFELKDDESEMSDSISSKRASVDVTSWTASTSSDPVEAPLKSPQKLPAGNGGSSKSTRTPTFNELYAMHAIPEGQPSSVARPQHTAVLFLDNVMAASKILSGFSAAFHHAGWCGPRPRAVAETTAGGGRGAF